MNQSKTYTAEDAHTKTVSNMSKPEKLQAFLSALDAVSRTYGFGIKGGLDTDGLDVEPVVFEMEKDDFDRAYRLNEDSELSFR